MNAKQTVSGASAFALSVLRFLEKVEYRRCDRGEDFEAVCRLRYKAYKASNLVPTSQNELVEDKFDFLENCYCFGVYVEEKLISTIRLHRVASDNPYSPCVAVYPDILEPRLKEGDSFVEPSRFAVDPEISSLYPQIPYVTQRIPWMACFYFNATCGISMIREDHVAFYRRFYKSKQIGSARDYGGVINCKALLYEVDIQAIKLATHSRFPFFKSTKMEQRLLFDSPSAGADAPLTILPTASSLRAAA